MQTIAINWFEVFLPSGTIKIYVEKITDPRTLPGKIVSVDHRTVLRKVDGEKYWRYHVTSFEVTNASKQDFTYDSDTQITEYAIEHGLATELAAGRFDVRLKHVGGIAFRHTTTSVKPDVYQSLEGIKFRAFWGFQDISPRRWGLILSYVTGQRFVISLAQPLLKRLAIGRRVVSLQHHHMEEADGQESADIESGVLKSANDSEGTLLDAKGRERSINLDEWTLACNKQNLLAFVRQKENEKAANSVSIALQRDSLTLTKDGRMNVSLAKDQLTRLQNLLRSNNLLAIKLALVDAPSARISQEPLAI